MFQSGRYLNTLCIPARSGSSHSHLNPLVPAVLQPAIRRAHPVLYTVDLAHRTANTLLRLPGALAHPHAARGRARAQLDAKDVAGRTGQSLRGEDLGVSVSGHRWHALTGLQAKVCAGRTAGLEVGRGVGLRVGIEVLHGLAGFVRGTVGLARRALDAGHLIFMSAGFFCCATCGCNFCLVVCLF